MSYYVWMNGMVLLKKDISKDDMTKVFAHLSEKADNVDTFPMIKAANIGLYGKYDSEFLDHVFGDVLDCIREASLEFTGEDGTFWKACFDGDNWRQTDGQKVYSISDVFLPHEIEVLISALESAGKNGSVDLSDDGNKRLLDKLKGKEDLF